MEVKRSKKTVEVEQEDLTATYTRREIKELIEADLKSRGLHYSEINFHCSSRIETDSWGMNSREVLDFKGASVKLEVE